MPYVDEMLNGLCLAHLELKRTGDGGRVVCRTQGAVAGKVGIVTGGGSGHLPVFLEHIRSLGCSTATPSATWLPVRARTTASRRCARADGGAGVLQLCGNYGGDPMNFIAMPREMLEHKGHGGGVGARGRRCRKCGCGSARTSYRRIAGLGSSPTRPRAPRLPVGSSLAEVAAITEKGQCGLPVDRYRVDPLHRALSPAKPSFEIAAHEVEFGMGIHGGPGIWRGPQKTARALTDKMVILRTGAYGEVRCATIFLCKEDAEGNIRRRMVRSGAWRNHSRETWIEAAFRAIQPRWTDLGEGGGTEPRPLRHEGSFYWHFENRGDLIAAVMEKWERRRPTASSSWPSGLAPRRSGS